MKYEIVELPEKTILTLPPVRLSNNDQSLVMKIEAAWQSFGQHAADITSPLTHKPIATYSNYESDETAPYDYSIGLEVSAPEQMSDAFILRTIPAGKYAKFIVHGDVKQAITEFWIKLWTMDLPRKFVCDFEEYQTNSLDDAEIHIYIRLQ